MQRIVLERFSYAPDGTFGRLIFPTGKTFFTVERPWLGNKPHESCIPDGVYVMERRRSPVVERTSFGAYSEGWEVTGVPERTYIMLHPGNWPHDFEGCIGVGLNYAVMHGANGVTQSRLAFAQVMDLLDGPERWEIGIRPFLMEYP